MKWSHASVPLLAKRAAAALRSGKCLEAGAIIDKAYWNLGRSGSTTGQKALRAVDAKFERVCVRKHPKRSH